MTSYQWLIMRAMVVLIVLFLLNHIGVFYHLYAVFWWWDVMTHFLGGIVIGFLVGALLSRFKSVPVGTKFVLAAGIAMVVFLGWEFYEIIVNKFIPLYRFDIIDTTHDVVNDSLGATVAYFWYKNFYPYNQS
jgi:hypothetical protein